MAQDEVSGLRDIIRHDAEADARALSKLSEIRHMIQASDLSTAEVGQIDIALDELEACITSTPTTKRAPGNLSLNLK